MAALVNEYITCMIFFFKDNQVFKKTIEDYRNGIILQLFLFGNFYSSQDFTDYFYVMHLFLVDI